MQRFAIATLHVYNAADSESWDSHQRGARTVVKLLSSLVQWQNGKQ
jgi:hypothetical protein